MRGVVLIIVIFCRFGCEGCGVRHGPEWKAPALQERQREDQLDQWEDAGRRWGRKSCCSWRLRNSQWLMFSFRVSVKLHSPPVFQAWVTGRSLQESSPVWGSVRASPPTLSCTSSESSPTTRYTMYLSVQWLLLHFDLLTFCFCYLLQSVVCKI